VFPDDRCRTYTFHAPPAIQVEARFLMRWLKQHSKFGMQSIQSGLITVSPRVRKPSGMSSDNSKAQPASAAAVTINPSQNCSL
jgi:hypothetical protein